MQQHPDAERAEREREDQDLEQRAAGDRVGRASVLVVLDGDRGRAVGEDDELGAVGGLEHLGGEDVGGRAVGDLARG